MARISIGEASRMSGVKVPTIRYYEQIGLLAPPARNDGNRRTFDVKDVRRLSFIRHSRELGFEIRAIQTLLTLQDAPNQPCAQVDAIARSRLEDVEVRIRSLEAMRVELSRMITECGQGNVAGCRVIEILADHSQCIAPHA